MPSVSRVSDIGVGVCPCHKSPVGYTTTFVSGASSVITEGSVTTNMTTVGVASCGHATVVLTVSGTVDAEGTGVHRVGDVGSNCGSYSSVSGASTVTAGG